MADYLKDPVILRVNGLDWTGWTGVSITRRLDAVAGSFNISLTDRAENGGEALPLAAGQACEILIGAEPVITGYIDTCAPSFNASSHSINISGRDKSGDLVDCSARHAPGHWLNQSALQLCAILAAPFGVRVSAAGDIGASFPSFKLEQGETAFEALDRALKQRELLACPDGRGNLELLQVGSRQSAAALVQGRNILSAEATFDLTDRFSLYLVQGQQPGTDEVYGEGAAQVAAQVSDPAVARHRPLLLRAENRMDPAAAQQRAAWEKSVRAARSVTLSVTVQGFRQQPEQPGSPLWQVNALTGVDIPYLRLKQDLLISAVTFNRDANGSTATLELRDPKAFQPAPKEESPASLWPTGPIEADMDVFQRYNIDADKVAELIKKGKS